MKNFTKTLNFFKKFMNKVRITEKFINKIIKLKNI